MKKIIIGLLLISSFAGFSQTDTIEPVENNHFKLFIGAGSSYNKSYNINRYFDNNGIIRIQQFDVNFYTGFNYYDDYVDIDLGYELLGNGNSNDKTKNRMRSNGVKLRAHYVLYNRKNIVFGAGFNIGYAKKNLDLYWRDYEVDFNTLPDGINGNQLSLFLEKGFLGPSICFNMRESGRNSQQTKVTLAYEFAITSKPWESEHFILKNQITEPNTRQVVLNVTFGL